MLWICFALGLLGAFALGRWAGWRSGVRQTREAYAQEAERMSRIEPSPRSPGQPTNLDAPPSVIRQPRIRESRWTEDGDVQR